MKMNKIEKEAEITQLVSKLVATIVTEALAETKTTETELAHRLGVPALYVKKLLAAEERPGIVMLARIADVLGLELKMGFFAKEPNEQEVAR